ncbi:MAG: PepSY-like domain-containing protein [Mediterranea sp.]|jgi:hypothetical protein|nr:PepSY-like domain-containing protein [Mediterranea sp.]
MKPQRFSLAFGALLLGLLALPISASAQYEQPVTKAQLPQKAQAFINQHFAQQEITYVIRDDDYAFPDYDVYFKSGIKVSFHNNGEWDEVNAGYGAALPTTFILPQIVSYVKSNHPNTTIVEIERDRRKFDVHLSNGLELTFGSNGALRYVEYDD